MIKNSKRATKQLDFTVTAVSIKDASGECVVEGYANTSTKDRVGDVVLPTAFAKSLPTYLKNPVLLENHNWDKIAGRTIEAKITDTGLFIKARVSDTRADLKTMVREGCLSTFSIGYNELDADFDESTKTKIVKELELLEISIVSVPANTEASFTVVDTTKAPAEEPMPEEKCEKCGKAACECEKEKSAVYTAADFKSFIIVAQEAIGDELDAETLIALCDVYNENGASIMKLNRKQLIEALKASIKSASASPAAAPVATAKPEAGKADAPAEQKPEGAPADAMKEVMAKLDAIAQACVQILQAMDEEESEEGEEAPAKPAEPAKPGEAPAKPADGKDASDLKDLSDEELASMEATIDAQLEELEDAQQ